MEMLPVAVIGAGPIGMAAACRLLERGEVPVVFEAAAGAAAAVRDWSHVRMFSSWAMNVDACAAAMLERQGWTMPPGDAIPTGGELVAAYLDPLARLPVLHRCLHYGHRVSAVTRRGFDKLRRGERDAAPFELRIERTGGETLQLLARAVIDASGTWSTPGPAGHSGLPALGETGHPRIAYGIPDVRGAAAARYAGRDTLVVGGGHSAINVLLDLVELRDGARSAITWVTRGPTPAPHGSGSAAEALLLPQRGSALVRATALARAGVIRTVPQFALEEIGQVGRSGRLLLRGLLDGQRSLLEADELIVCTGFRPDLGMLRELQLELDPWLESSAGVGRLIRHAAANGQAIPQPHGAATLGHPESGVFVVGMKSHGRAPNFFLFHGYEQVRSVAAWLCGDMAAAARVELELPAGAVCAGCGDGACCGSVGGAQSCGGGPSGCCGDATQAAAAAASAAIAARCA